MLPALVIGDDFIIFVTTEFLGRQKGRKNLSHSLIELVFGKKQTQSERNNSDMINIM